MIDINLKIKEELDIIVDHIFQDDLDIVEITDDFVTCFRKSMPNDIFEIDMETCKNELDEINKTLSKFCKNRNNNKRLKVFLEDGQSFIDYKKDFEDFFRIIKDMEYSIDCYSPENILCYLRIEYLFEDILENIDIDFNTVIGSRNIYDSFNENDEVVILDKNSLIASEKFSCKKYFKIPSDFIYNINSNINLLREGLDKEITEVLSRNKDISIIVPDEIVEAYIKEKFDNDIIIIAEATYDKDIDSLLNKNVNKKSGILIVADNNEDSHYDELFRLLAPLGLPTVIICRNYKEKVNGKSIEDLLQEHLLVNYDVIHGTQAEQIMRYIEPLIKTHRIYIDLSSSSPSVSLQKAMKSIPCIINSSINIEESENIVKMNLENLEVIKEIKKIIKLYGNPFEEISIEFKETTDQSKKDWMKILK